MAADAESLGFTLLPADDEDITAEDALAAAVGAALDEPLPVAEDPPVPFGRSWSFDFEQGRFRRAGGAPAEVRGFDALEVWVLTVVHSARWAHGVFSDEFGMEYPEDGIGELGSDEYVSDWGARLQDALLPHDRIVGVENFAGHWDGDQGIIFIDNFEVVTDEGERVRFGGLGVSTVVFDGS